MPNSTSTIGTRTLHRFIFLTESTQMVVEEEILIYDLGDLVADTGGYLGLLLGLSLLSLVEMAIKGCQRLA